MAAAKAPISPDCNTCDLIPGTRLSALLLLLLLLLVLWEVLGFRPLLSSVCDRKPPFKVPWRRKSCRAVKAVMVATVTP